jgi:hypothetical protein
MRCSEHGNENSGSLKCDEIAEQPISYYFLGTDYAFRSFFPKRVTSKNKLSYTDQLCVSVAVGFRPIVLDDDNDNTYNSNNIPKSNAEHPLIH